MPKGKKKPVVTKFKVGDNVRVKHGVTDVDYPDMPLGGWAGAISEIHKSGMYTVRWSQETLAAIHPVFKKRCERDGMVLEDYWLGDDDLEPDTGGPLRIEHPTEITAKPLSPKDQDDRVRMVFGLTSNDPLPNVDDGTLKTYHKYLSKDLAFPFAAEHGAEYGHPEKVKVIGLGDPDEDPQIDEVSGLLCEARMEGHVVTLPLGELEDAKPNRQAVADYCYWLHNWS
ncbi:MAG: hypothetical protein NTY19_04060 [Planctomycetota bacterium]|nr:hypothetical protein [Planctomycetota bacterium]